MGAEVLVVVGAGVISRVDGGVAVGCGVGAEVRVTVGIGVAVGTGVGGVFTVTLILVLSALPAASWVASVTV